MCELEQKEFSYHFTTVTPIMRDICIFVFDTIFI